MNTIDKIITQCNCKYGAPRGRGNVGKCPAISEPIKVFDCKVSLNQGYDKGDAYWGLPNNLRVQYTKDLSYIKFYRT